MMFTLFQLAIIAGLIIAAAVLVVVGLLILNAILTYQYREEDAATWQQYRDANEKINEG